jgi:hypothetical protein
MLQRSTRAVRRIRLPKTSSLLLPISFSNIPSVRSIHTNKTLFKAEPQRVEQTEPKQTNEEFAAIFLDALEHNALGDVAGAVSIYEKLKSKYSHLMELKHYNAIISSFAPRKLMFGWFAPYKDYVDMYYEASKFRTHEVRYILHN